MEVDKGWVEEVRSAEWRGMRCDVMGRMNRHDSLRYHEYASQETMLGCFIFMLKSICLWLTTDDYQHPYSQTGMNCIRARTVSGGFTVRDNRR